MGLLGVIYPFNIKWLCVICLIFFFLNFDINFKIRLFPTTLPSTDRNGEEDLTRDPRCLHHSIDLNDFITQPSSENVQRMKQESAGSTSVIPLHISISLKLGCCFFKLSSQDQHCIKCEKMLSPHFV